MAPHFQPFIVDHWHIYHDGEELVSPSPFVVVSARVRAIEASKLEQPNNNQRLTDIIAYASNENDHPDDEGI